MTIHEAIFSAVRQPLLGVLYLIITLQMVMMFSTFRDKSDWRLRLGCLVHLLLSLACLWFTFMDIASNPFRTGVPAPLPPARSLFTQLPVWTLFLYEAVTAVIIAFVLRHMLRWRKANPTSYSIKETMDLLPAGIAYGRTDGTVVFSNLSMNRLSRALRGKSLTDLNAFRKAMTEDPAKGNAFEEQAELPDGSGVWQISSGMPEVDGESFIQLTATDITEQAEVLKELEDKNKKLRDIQMRLDIYNKQADRIIIAQELLTARMAVHSEVGNVLLESWHYLSDPASFDEERLLSALKNTNTYLLKEYEEDDTSRDPLTDAVEMAQAIGVDVMISGLIPSDDPYRTVLAAAINECASNTVKHANGDSLSVKIQSTGDDIIYILQSNGKAPEEPVREAGGLLSLRTLVEKESGSMAIVTEPEFLIKISLIKK